jgi:hypothetical protein
MGGAASVGLLALLVALVLLALLARAFTQTLGRLMTWPGIGFVCSIMLSVGLFVLALNKLNSK